MDPKLIPAPDMSMSLKQKVWEARGLIPVAILIVGVIGAIYTGIASPTDAAALGVVLSILLAFLSGSFTKKDFLDALLSAACTSCMIAFILLGAAFLSVAMGFTGLPRNLASWIGDMGLSPYTLIVVLTLFFIVLGLFLDGISVVVLTTSIIMPMVMKVGIDPIWFGIYLVIVVEMSQITPPVGFNLFVIQGLTGIDILRIAKAALPFFALMLLAVLLITMFPEIVTYLPDAMNN